jgi:tRNA modification GTPase
MCQPSPRLIRLTPPGRGAVATLRIEGPGALEAVQSHFRSQSGRPLAAYAADRLVVGHFGHDGGEEIVLRRCGNAVELHCHGGRAAVAMIEETLIAAGCRSLPWRDWAALLDKPAVAPEPVILDKPAVAPGPISPDKPAVAPSPCAPATAAAALIALADARTERTAAILLDQYQGAFDRAMSHIQQAIDRGDRSAARRQVEELSARVALGRHLVTPWRVVLAGRTNVGKSSLVNALAGYDRSIVHATPGTTRDVVTLVTAIDGWPVELCDTAGLGVGGNAVERAGIERAREWLAEADLVILVADGSQTWSKEDETLLDRWPDALLVHNKCDLPPGPGDRPSGLTSSAMRGDGIKDLLATLSKRLVPAPPPAGGAVPFTAAQVEMVRRLETISQDGRSATTLD